jgi:isopenicillin N synthase-like dioxygenase
MEVFLCPPLCFIGPFKGHIKSQFFHWEKNQRLLSFSVFAEESEVLDLDVIPNELFSQEDPQALRVLKQALHEKGIVGIRGVPGYQDKLNQFVEKARIFSLLPEEVKDAYAPNRERGDLFLGYEKGWVVDDLKVSYYAFVPEHPSNRWPAEVDLQTSFQSLGMLMADMGKAVMEKVDLIGPATDIILDGVPQVGRMLYYQKSADTCKDNPFWCGAHFDHGIFTVITPASYFIDGKRIGEPQEAGLFVNVNGHFKKVEADPEVMMFEVGEFGQLMTHDAIRATEHRVHKASGSVERYALAIFFDAPMDTVIHSFSELTQDACYGGGPGDPCSFDILPFLKEGDSYGVQL